MMNKTYLRSRIFYFILQAVFFIAQAMIVFSGLFERNYMYYLIVYIVTCALIMCGRDVLYNGYLYDICLIDSLPADDKIANIKLKDKDKITAISLLMTLLSGVFMYIYFFAMCVAAEFSAKSVFVSALLTFSIAIIIISYFEYFKNYKDLRTWFKIGKDDV